MTNTGNYGQTTEVDVDREFKAALSLPLRLRNFVLYECTENVNALQLVEVKESDPFLAWHDIERMVREFSRDAHRASYGGIYPGDYIKP